MQYVDTDLVNNIRRYLLTVDQDADGHSLDKESFLDDLQLAMINPETEVGSELVCIKIQSSQDVKALRMVVYCLGMP